MRIIQIVAVLLAVAICQSLTAAERMMAAQFSSYDFNQSKRFDFNIYEDDLSGTPAWRIDEEFPPLSPRKAEASARDQLKKLVKQPQRWSRKEIALHQMGDSDKWIYVIHFMGFLPPNVADGAVPEMRLVVFMNGRVLAPIISPYGKGNKTR